MLIQDFSNLDGEVIDLDIVPASQTLTGNPYEEDFYPASGRMRARRDERRAKRDSRRDERQGRRTERTASKSQARQTRAQAKLGQAEAQKELGRSMSDRSTEMGVLPAPADRAQAVNQTNVDTTGATKPGLSMGAKIGIGVGIVAVIGIVYMMTKGKGSGK